MQILNDQAILTLPRLS